MATVVLRRLRSRVCICIFLRQCRAAALNSVLSSFVSVLASPEKCLTLFASLRITLS